MGVVRVVRVPQCLRHQLTILRGIAAIVPAERPDTVRGISLISFKIGTTCKTVIGVCITVSSRRTHALPQIAQSSGGVDRQLAWFTLRVRHNMHSGSTLCALMLTLLPPGACVLAVDLDAVAVLRHGGVVDWWARASGMSCHHAFASLRHHPPRPPHLPHTYEACGMNRPF